MLPGEGRACAQTLREVFICPRKAEDISMAAVSRGMNEHGRRVRNQSRPGCAEISEDSAEGLWVKVGMQKSDQIHNMLRRRTCGWPRWRGLRKEQVFE